MRVRETKRILLGGVFSLVKTTRGVSINEIDSEGNEHRISGDIMIQLMRVVDVLAEQERKA